MKKLLIFIGSLQAGGAERVVSELSSKFLEHFEVCIITYYNRPQFYKVNGRIRILEIEKNTNSTNFLKNLFWLRKYVQEYKPNIVLSFLAPFNIFCLISLWGVGVSIIVCERSDPRYSPSNYFVRILRNIIYNFATGVVFQTEMCRSYFSTKIQNRGIVIPNPCFVKAEYIGSSLLLRHKHNKIVTVARLIPSKNLEMLIDTFFLFHLQHLDYKLFIYGEGPERPILEDKLQYLGLKQSVFLLGNVSNIWDAISDADFFVLPSNYEGMPNALIEAMALGIPVISTKVAGTKELITDYVNGRLVDIGDSKALLEAMIDMSEDFNKRISYSRKAVTKIEEYRLDFIMERWVRFLNSIS